MRATVLPLAFLLIPLISVVAQEHQHQPSPYAAQEPSGIASLSAGEVRDLENGAGMALARAAELNHHPGPLHVLELADSLGLTAEQRERTTAIREAMLERAVELGRRIVEAERHLSDRFAHGHVDSASVAAATEAIGRLYGELRYVHLAAHLAMKQVLTPVQVAAYDRLRGY